MLREVIVPIYPILVRLSLEPFIQIWGLQYRKEIGLIEQIQKRALKMIRELEQLSYGDRLRDLELFTLEKRRLQGGFIAAFQYIKGERQRLFTRACSDKMQSKMFKMKEDKFRVDMTKNFFTMTVVIHLNMLPGEVVEASSLKVY